MIGVLSESARSSSKVGEVFLDQFVRCLCFRWIIQIEMSIIETSFKLSKILSGGHALLIGFC